MNWDEYATEAKKTAVFTNDFYPVASLPVELVELIEAYGSGAHPSDIVAEAGDVIWQTSAICDLVGVDLWAVVRHSVAVDVTSFSSLMMPVVKMTDEFIKPILRGDDKKPDRQVVFNALVSTLSCVGFILANNRSSLHDAAAKNLEKLRDRQARGVLKGSGGDR